MNMQLVPPIVTRENDSSIYSLRIKRDFPGGPEAKTPGSQ